MLFVDYLIKINYNIQIFYITLVYDESAWLGIFNQNCLTKIFYGS